MKTLRTGVGRRLTPTRVTVAGALAALVVLSVVSRPAPGTPRHAGLKASATPGGVAVSITRDRAGIPHIRAGGFLALGYGEGYAFSQDNLCQLAEQFVTVNGQRSKYFGPSALSVNYSAGTSDTNLSSDLYWRYIKSSGLVQRELSVAPPNGPLPEVRELYTGFAQGYNAYLRSGKLRDPRCAGKPWVRPIALTDLFLRGAQIVTEGSAAQFISGFASAAPPSGTTAPDRGGTPPKLLDVNSLNSLFGDSADRAEGSNGVGLGARDTRSGQGMVLANPHFPWRGTERFWITQLTVPGQYDVEGGTLEGFPLIGIGFNRHIAWTHTVSTSRRFALYQLKLVPGDPTSYYLDGQPQKMGRVTVNVDTGHGAVVHTFYTTRWGLVTNVPAANYAWTVSTAYALYDAVAEASPRAANEYLRMGQAASVQALFGAQAKYLAIPTFNTVAADDRGTAYYGDVGATPNISQAKINGCTPSGPPQLIFRVARVVTLDGSRATCAPDDDPGTPVRGIFSASHLPHLMRRDYVENSNDSFWLANPAAPLTGFSPIIGLSGVQQGLRTRLGNEMIAQRVAGTDHHGAPKFTLRSLQSMWLGNRSKLAELVLGSLVAACSAHPSAQSSDGQAVDLSSACSALRSYDQTGSLDAKGGWLFSEWNRHFVGASFWSDAFDPARPLSTPSRLNAANPEALRALADAVLTMHAHGLAPEAPYRAVQHATRRNTKIPIPGCDSGCFNAINAADDLSKAPATQAPYGEVYAGSSLVMTTELNPGGPNSRGILTYSQATDPTSPWFANMTQIYSRKQWVPLPYTPEALQRSNPLPTLSFSVH